MVTLVKSFDDIQQSDISNLGIENVLFATSDRVPNNNALFGMVTTSDAYWYFLETNDLFDALLLNVRNVSDRTLDQISEKCRTMIINGKVPYNLFRSLTKQYEKMKENGCVAEEVEMWAEFMLEKNPTIAFPKNEFMYAKVKDWDSLIHNLKVFYASLFETSSILAHLEMGHRLMDISVSVRFQPAVNHEQEMETVPNYSLARK